MKKLLLLPLVPVLSLLLSGCALYGTATDERLVDTQTSDKGISMGVKKDLMGVKLSEGWDISVYCYYGHVFLVGECPEGMREKALNIARKRKDVRSVIPHWFTWQVGRNSDTALTAKVWSALIGASNVNSTRINIQCNANRVVLLGVARDSAERKRAVRAAREVEGVETVTSYIMLPEKPGENSRPTGITYPGLKPNA